MDEFFIRRVFRDGKDNNASHIIIVEEEPNEWCVLTLPVYVFPEQNVNEQVIEQIKNKYVKVVSVLNLSEDEEEQVKIAMVCARSKTNMEN
jgi:hypothetical protein